MHQIGTIVYVYFQVSVTFIFNIFHFLTFSKFPKLMFSVLYFLLTPSFSTLPPPFSHFHCNKDKTAITPVFGYYSWLVTYFVIHSKFNLLFAETIGTNRNYILHCIKVKKNVKRNCHFASSIMHSRLKKIISQQRGVGLSQKSLEGWNI